jgi:hypothetical protein
MSKREKIIVGLMVLSLLYGAVDLIFFGRKKPGPTAIQRQQSSTLATFITEVSAGMKTEPKIGQTDVKYIIDRAREPFKGDPFLDRAQAAYFDDQRKKDEELRAKGSQAPLATGLAYTGYLASGDTALAVINGVEYEVGDLLDVPGGYVVQLITPTQAVIGREGSTDRLVLPMEESE